MMIWACFAAIGAFTHWFNHQFLWIPKYSRVECGNVFPKTKDSKHSNNRIAEKESTCCNGPAKVLKRVVHKQMPVKPQQIEIILKKRVSLNSSTIMWDADKVIQ